MAISPKTNCGNNSIYLFWYSIISDRRIMLFTHVVQHLIIVFIQMQVITAEIRMDVDNTAVDFADLLYPCQRFRPGQSANANGHSHKKKESAYLKLNQRNLRTILESQSESARKKTSHDDVGKFNNESNRLLQELIFMDNILPSNNIFEPINEIGKFAGVHFDSPNVDETVVDSTIAEGPPTEIPTASPTFEPWVVKRLPHIEPINSFRHEMLLRPVIENLRKYPNFKIYVQNHTNIDPSKLKGDMIEGEDQPETLSEIAEKMPGSVWRPSPHRPPYALFDINSHHTRLTMCEQDKYFLDNNFLWERMRNRRLVFIGDSVTRYQYLDLVYFLTYKRWNRDLRLVNERQYGNWTEFFESTNGQFNPPNRKVNELCECHRTTCCGTWHLNENRKYINEELNAIVWFFTWFGDVSVPHGHFDVRKDIQPLECMPSNCHEFATNKAWKANSTAEFLYTFALYHRPDHIILNTGLHTPMDGRNSLFVREAKEWRKLVMMLQHAQEQEDDELEEGAARLPRTKFVYKSVTSLVQDDHVADQRDSDFGALELAAHGVWDYWDVASMVYELYVIYRKLETAYNFYHGIGIVGNDTAQTGEINAASISSTSLSNRGFGWDPTHYTPWVYREINRVMIMKLYSNISVS